MPSAPTTTFAIGKGDDRLIVVLREADAAMVGVDDLGQEHLEQIGPVHAVGLRVLASSSSVT
jgi:hypothetical protein